MVRLSGLVGGVWAAHHRKLMAVDAKLTGASDAISLHGLHLWIPERVASVTVLASPRLDGYQALAYEETKLCSLGKVLPSSNSYQSHRRS